MLLEPWGGKGSPRHQHLFYCAIIRKLVVVSRCWSADSQHLNPRSAGAAAASALNFTLTGALYQTLWSSKDCYGGAGGKKGAGHSIWARASPNGTETKDDRQYRKFYPSNIDRKEMIGESRGLRLGSILAPLFLPLAEFLFCQQILHGAKNNQGGTERGRHRRNGK